MRGVVLGVILALAAGMVTAGVVGSRPKPGVSVSGIYTPAGDSVNVRVTVTSKDAQGQAVTQFAIEWLQAGVQVAVVIVPGALSVTLVRTFAAPLAGDTALYSACVTATDRKGQTSRACSGYLRVLGPPWTPPTPPVITLDTLLVSGTPDPAVYPWNYDSLTAYLMGGIRVGNADQGERPVEFTYLTQTVEVCYLAWYGSSAEVPRFRVAAQTNDSTTLRVEAMPRRSDCLAVTALRPTQLGLSGDAQAYRRALP